MVIEILLSVLVITHIQAAENTTPAKKVACIISHDKSLSMVDFVYKTLVAQGMESEEAARAAVQWHDSTWPVILNPIPKKDATKDSKKE